MDFFEVVSLLSLFSIDYFCFTLFDFLFHLRLCYIIVNKISVNHLEHFVDACLLIQLLFIGRKHLFI